MDAETHARERARDRARIAALEEELAAAEERLRRFEEERYGIGLRAPMEFGLTGKEAAVLMQLAGAEDGCTKQQIMDGLYWDRPNDEPELKIVDVFICKIRAKVADWDIAIETVWGRGYRMADASRKKIADMMANPAGRASA